MPFAAALSEHPVAADAVGEVLGAIVERGGTEPALAVVFVSAAHAEFMGEISAAVRTVLQPETLIGTVTSAVVGGPRVVEDVPALSIWAAWARPMRGIRLTTEQVDGAAVVVGLPKDIPESATIVLVADPFSFPAQEFIDGLASIRPDVSVVGGLVSSSDAASGSTLLLDETVHRDGAIAVVVPREHLVGPVVSQGCRPVGDAMTVTAADRSYLLELAGRPALERLTELRDTLLPEDRALLAGGVHLGVAINESSDEFARGDFLVRSIIGGDRDRGVLAVGDQIPVGATVQFHVRDAVSAHDDLHELLQDVHGDGALLFTCNGRGSALFGTDDHDAAAVVDLVGTHAVAGMSCAGELGPVGGRSFLHGFTASVLVFTDS